jgi:hypothetical protein
MGIRRLPVLADASDELDRAVTQLPEARDGNVFLTLARQSQDS